MRKFRPVRPAPALSMITWMWMVLAAIGIAGRLQATGPLTTIEYTVSGQSLQVTPSAVAVPKGIPGSVLTTVGGQVPEGAYVEAWLRGPSFPARRLVALPNEPMLFPPLNLVGDYSLDGIRLVDANSGATLLEGTPASVPVRVFDEVLISRVTSRPLTLEEIREKGIVIDENNYRAVEFEVGFVLDGVTIPVRFPVVAPNFTQSTEIIPSAELEEQLAEVERINAEIAQGVVLPPELETVNVNIQMKGINFQFVDGEDPELALQVPPIPALMVIPGNIGFLNQFFSVMIFTENGAPAGSGLSVREIEAEIILPAGNDRVPGTYENPGDDPLRMARVGPEAQVFTTQPVVRPGPDGELGTGDEIPRLQPGETGQAEFLVEGLQEGLHVLDLRLNALLDGLAAGSVAVEGRAAGSVLVRNPNFSMAFSHPRTVRAGEPYDAYVTILNTSNVPANLVTVNLNRNSVSGGILESPETVQLGTILPGETATANYRIRSQRTGSITFSNLTTSDDSLVGRFRLRAGVDERGVALSPDTLLLPDFVDELPPELVNAANRILGQALSIATAGQLPAGVTKVQKSYLLQKAVELAEAGQRVRYGEPLARILPDLLLDWQGARDYTPGWDQILRTTEAGLEWREAVASAMEAADPGRDFSRQLVRAAPNLAGRGEAWLFASHPVAGELQLKTSSGAMAGFPESTIVQGHAYPGSNGSLLASAQPGVLTWTLGDSPPSGSLVGVWEFNGDGTAGQLTWDVSGLPAGSCLRYDTATGSGILEIDTNCDGASDQDLAAGQELVTELPPEVLAVRQDPEVLVGRPSKPCPQPWTTNESGEPVSLRNYANVLAVLFSKPMTQATANVPQAYRLENGNQAAFVKVQPGGRVALLTMREPVGALIPRSLTVGAEVTDVRGNPVTATPVEVESRLVEGVTVMGRVIRANGSAAPGVPVTLTYYDQIESLFGCQDWTTRSTQVFTNQAGEFSFDFVLNNIPYSISATDTSNLSPEAVDLILQSIQGDQLNTGLFQQLVEQRNAQGTLLEEFSAGSLPEAIAQAEGLDRALVRDFVDSASPRLGTEAVFALRFRGRGTVLGQVLESDGITPAAGAAVNLYPDPDSRELGRGLYADGEGRFAFFGVPLGVFSIEATSPAGRTRVIADVIDTPEQVKEVVVELSESIVALTTLQGRVTEPDGTPHAGARVYIGRYVDGRYCCIVATATADTEGYWTAEGVPEGIYDPLAVSSDTRRKGDRRGIQAVAGTSNTVNIALQARAIVNGRVETSTGVPVPNAIVGGGEALVRTDSLGRFILTGVPTGQRTLSAGLERNPAAGIEFPRLGSASLFVVPGDDNFAVIRLVPAGRIIGRVLDVAGAPIPNATVAIPQPDGFMWVDADDQGNYEFVGLGLGNYDVSSPAPATASVFDTAEAFDALRSGNQQEILAAMGEAYAAFTGVNDPLLNGDGSTFNPRSWGFVKDVRLSFDGHTAVADIRHLGASTISGTVLNGQGVPIGARVRLTGIGPSLKGKPTMIIRGERNSDPALGTFSFEGQALIGDWGLQAASPFFNVVITASGRTTSLDPDASGIILQFPEIRETNGSLSGQVLNPDGSPAGADVDVQISFGPDFIIRTDEDGRFATQRGTYTLPAGGYTVTATDPLTGATGRASASVQAGQDNSVTVRLLGRGNASIQVVLADGSPAANASVVLQGGAYPGERFEGTTDTAGVVLFENLFEGPYAASASLVTGSTRISGRAGLTVPLGQTGSATVALAGTASVEGTFLAGDGFSPIAFANVALGKLAYTSTDAEGRFSFLDVPLGNYRIVATDAVSGRSGAATVILSQVNETRRVTIVQTALGNISGYVVNGYGTGYVPNVEVTLDHADAFVGDRVVTTGPEGSFSFPATPAGDFSLRALDPLTGSTGRNNGTLSATTGNLQMNIQLQELASLAVQVLEQDGLSPADNANVSLRVGQTLLSADTDENGRVLFAGVPVSAQPVNVLAHSLSVVESRSWAGARPVLNVQGAQETVSLVLSGISRVQGRVLLGDGSTPVAGAEVRMEIGSEGLPVEGGSLSRPSAGESETVIADEEGRYAFENLPPGTTRLRAISQSLGASVDLAIPSAGLDLVQNLILTPSGTVSGRVLRADESTPAEGTEVLLSFSSQSGLPGRLNTTTGPDGSFSLSPVPVGDFSGEFVLTALGGLALRSGSIAANGEVLDLGDIVLDEEFPQVESITPVDSADGVDINTSVELVFSEALDPDFIFASGIFIREAGSGITIPASLQLQAPEGESVDNLRRLVMSPDSPLVSETTYQVIVVDGNLLSPTGTITNRGPRDRVGRPLTNLFSATFTTRDQQPPTLLSFTPGDGSEQVDVRSVVRLSFDEAIAAGASIQLEGPDGLVAGSTTLGLNSLVLVFTPDVELKPNATYTATVNGVADLAGNSAGEQPFITTFSTLDTMGPVITELRLQGDPIPTAGANVVIEALLEQAEPGASIRVSANLVSIGQSAPGVLEIPYTLPPSGTVTLRAVAIDRFGNEGPLAELPVTIQANQPPAIQFEKLVPGMDTVGSGGLVQVRVSATDDSEVAELRAAVSGAATVNLRTSSGDPITLATTVPATSMAGSTVDVRAVATDNSGATSGEQVFQIPVSDATAPTIQFVSPAELSVVDPGQPFLLQLQWRDNSTDPDLLVEVDGVAVDPVQISLSGSVNTLNLETVELDLSAAGLDDEGFLVSLTVTDQAGNQSSASRAFLFPDLRPPVLDSISPVPGAENQSLWTEGWTMVFSEAMAAGSLVTDNFRVIDRGGNDLPFTIQIPAPDTVRIAPAVPLPPSATISLIALPGLTDLAGNSWQLAGGVDPPEGGQAFNLTTAQLEVTAPVEDAPIVPGQTIEVGLTFGSGLGADTFSADFNGDEPVSIFVGEASNTVSMLLTLPVTATEAVLQIAAEKEGFNSHLLPARKLSLQPRDSDTDGDGILNGDEVDAGLDPFRDDTAEDLDNDGLTNADEISRGTLPANPDTDEDGLLDGEEVDLGTDPLDSDSDNDGIPDGQDPFPLDVNRAPLAVDDSGFSVPQGQSLQITQEELLANDSDPDGDAISFDAEFPLSPAKGTATYNGSTGRITYTADLGATGSDSFDYRITDEWGLTAQASVSISIGENRPPLAGDGPGLKLVFPEGNGRVTLPNALIQSSAAVTIDTWFRVEPGSPGGVIFGYQNQPYPTGPGNWVPVLYVGTDGFLRGEFWFALDPIIAAVDVRDGEWHHVVLTTSGNGQSLYLDGVARGSKTGAINHLGMIHNQIGTGYTGSWPSGNGGWFGFQGEIDQFRVWHREVSAEEVEEMILAGAPLDLSALAAWYDFSLDSANQVVDISGNANDGLLQGQESELPFYTASDSPAGLALLRFSAVAGNGELVTLAGSDPDNDPISGIVVDPPLAGSLYQYEGGQLGALIDSFPAPVTDAAMRLFYVPGGEFTGADTFTYQVTDGIDVSNTATVRIEVVEDFSPVSNDLWDVSLGATVTATSGTHSNSQPENMFGGSGGVEPEMTLFADGQPAGSTHFVEWSTAQPVLLEAVRLMAFQDGTGTGQRAFTEMRLFSRISGTDPFIQVATYTVPEVPYAPTNELKAFIAVDPLVGQEFRAEFDQFWGSVWGGPRIRELDGLGEFVTLVPIPGDLIPLQNATADASQAGFPVGNLIDGQLAGWAGDVGGTPPLTAVMETVADVEVGADGYLTFTLVQEYGSSHFLGRFRLSATTDPRSEFADGLAGGGDITANWTVLDILDVKGRGGETFNLLEDGSILVSGTMPSTTTYSIIAQGIDGPITGFRIEMLEDASLPTNGPGRARNGNWVLSEFEARFPDYGFNRPPTAADDTYVGTQGFALTTGNVLSNDSDPEGGLLTVSTFSQGSNGTVADNGNGTFTYTPDSGFSGDDTFTYTATDGFQESNPATVTITINPSDVVAWTNPAGGDFNNPANWQPARVPTATDKALIGLPGSYTVSLSSDASFTSIEVGGAGVNATLRTAGRSLTLQQDSVVRPGSTVLIDGSGWINPANGSTLAVEGHMDFQHGGLGNAGTIHITASATGELSTSNNKFLNGYIENSGTLTYTGINIRLSYATNNLVAGITNNAGGTFIIDGEGGFAQWNSSNNLAINNAGTLIKRGQGTLTVVNGPIAFNNSGDIQIESGTLRLGGTSSIGGSVSGAGTLQLINGSHRVVTGADFDVPSLYIQSADFEIQAGVSSTLQSIDQNGGNVYFNENTNIANYVLRGGGWLYRRNSATLTITGTLSLDSGGLGAGQALVLAGGSTGTLEGTGNKFLNSFIENSGTLTYSGTNIRLSYATNNLVAGITNNAGGTFIIDGEGDFAQWNSSSNLALNNAGTLIKRGQGTLTVVNGPIAFNNSGDVQVESGTLRLGGTSSIEGRISGAGAFQLINGSHTIATGADFEVASLYLQSADFEIQAGVTTTLQSIDQNGGNVFFDEDTSIANYILRGGGWLYRRNNATLTITGTLNLDSGGLGAGQPLVLAEGSTGTLEGTGNKLLNSFIENNGTLIYSGTNIRLSYATNDLVAGISNNASGVFIIDGEGDFAQWNSSSNLALNNAGTLIKRGQGTLTIINGPIAFNNSGDVQIESGTLRLGGTSSIGGSVSGAGALQLINGSHTVATGADFDVPSLYIQSAEFEIQPGVTTTLQSIDQNGGNVYFDEDTSITNYTLRGGGWLHRRNSAVLTISGTLNYDNGGLGAGAPVVLAEGSTGTLHGASNKLINCFIENSGTLTYTGTNIRLSYAANNLAAGIENTATGTFIIEGEGDFDQWNSSINLAINNAGILIKRGEGTLSVVNGPVAFNNTGNVQIESGTLRLGGTSSIGGTVSSTGGDLQLINGSHTVTAGTDFAISSLYIQSADLDIQAGANSALQSIDQNGGNVYFNEDTTIVDYTLRGGGWLHRRSNAVLTISGSFSYDNGGLGAGAAVVLAEGSAGTLHGTSNKLINCFVENRGTLTYTGNGIRFSYAANNLSAGIVNNASGLFIIDGEGDFSQWNSSVNLAVNNAGTLIKRGAGTRSDINGPVVFRNSGTLLIESGTMRIPLGIHQTNSQALTEITGGALDSDSQIDFNNGTVSLVSGSVSDSIAVSGTLQAGPGPFTVGGNLTLASTAQTELRLAGGSGENHTALNVTGTAFVDGPLHITLSPGFEETTGTTFTAFGFAALTGGFTSITGLDQSGYILSSTINETALNLEVIQSGGLVQPLSLLDQFSFQSWRSDAFENYHAVGDFSRCGPAVDPDADGLCNLVEYAMGLDPLAANRAYPVISLTRINGSSYVDLIYPRSSTALDVDLVLEFSSDGLHWSPLTRVVNMSPASLDGSVFWVTERSLFPVDSLPLGLFRLRVQPAGL